MILQADMALEWLVPGLLHRSLVKVVDRLTIQDNINNRASATDLERIPIAGRLHRIFPRGNVAIERPA